MDLNQIGQFISNYGFPIIACAALFWQNNKQDENHKESIEKMTSVISDNTAAINKILNYIEATDAQKTLTNNG